MSVKQQGCTWEDRVDSECKFFKVLFVKLGKDKWTPRGFVAADGVIDRILFYKDWVALIDYKSIKSNDRLTYSDLNQSQVQDLLTAELAGHKSGYLCHFMKEDGVVFFSASQLSEVAPGSSIHASEGEYMGTFQEFALGSLFQHPITRGLYPKME